VSAERLRAVRALVGAYAAVWLAVRLPHHLDLADLPAHRWAPVGLFGTLADPPPAALARVVAVAAVPVTAAFAAGWRPRLTGPLAALAVFAVTSYASSWGQLFHTENLVVLHLAILAVAAVLGARRADPATVLQAMAVATAAAYVVSGVAKVRNGGWSWVDGDALRNQVAFDNLRKAVVGAPHSPIGAAALRHGWLFAPMAVVALAVELGAPVALAGRRAAVAWSATAWAFHVGVLALMAIGFPYQLAGVAFAPLLPVERLRLPSLRRRWSVSSSPSPSSASP
jgi:hypothetical protein